MNNAENFPVDVEAERALLNAYRARTGRAWTKIAREIGVPVGTLTPWASGSYAGRYEPIAREVFKFRQMVEQREEQSAKRVAPPSFIELPTAVRIRSLLSHAQLGKITMAATGPGMGKTFTMNEYAASISNVWTVTIRPTTRTLSAMIQQVLRALGGSPKGTWTRQMSEEVINSVRNTKGLIVIDEAGYLERDSLEELRGWHDVTGIGICLLGNSDLYKAVRGGARHDAFGRLNSRISAGVELTELSLRDVETYLDAWKIESPTLRAPLLRIGTLPSGGGLREVREIIEMAALFAFEDDVQLEMTHLKAAIATRATGNAAGLAA